MSAARARRTQLIACVPNPVACGNYWSTPKKGHAGDWFLVFAGALKIERDGSATASVTAALVQAHGLSGYDSSSLGAVPG